MNFFLVFFLIFSFSFGQNQKDLTDSMHRISEEIIPYFKKTKWKDTLFNQLSLYIKERNNDLELYR